MIIKGRSQQDNTSKGVDNPSSAVSEFRVDHFVPEEKFSQVKLIREMRVLWVSSVDQSHLLGDSQMLGRRKRVGMRIFSIVIGLCL